MKLENEFTVDTSIDEAWKALNDLERVTPCLPGAQLTAEVGDEYEGTMTVKMGPVTQKYNGTVKIEDADESAHRAVIRADGKDARGQGTASATITSTLSEEDGGTKVHVETDMHLTGRVAQFGRGVQQEVANKLINQFAECLEKEIMGENNREEPEQPEAAEEPEEAAIDAAEDDKGEKEEPKRRVIKQDHEVEPLDLGEASREAVLKRVIPLIAGLGALIVVIWLVRRRH